MIKYTPVQSLEIFGAIPILQMGKYLNIGNSWNIEKDETGPAPMTVHENSAEPS
jgi:hypothetical protein